jgi:hypothetical protein
VIGNTENLRSAGLAAVTASAASAAVRAVDSRPGKGKEAVLAGST